MKYRVKLKADPGYLEMEGQTAIPELDIFVTEGRTYGDCEAVLDGETFVYEVLPKPVREGYEFSFWYADEEPGEYLFEEKIIRSDKEVEPVEDRVFYAVWEMVIIGVN